VPLKLKIMSLVLTSLILPFLFFKEDTRQIYCSGDVCDLAWNHGLLIPDPHGESALVISTGKFVSVDKVPSMAPFKEAWRGVYSRWDLPLAGVVFLGVLLPVAFLGAAIWLALARRRRPAL
jgi:hypothetical protein